MATATTAIDIYALGPCYLSVCAPVAMTATDVEKAVNAEHPTGIKSDWSWSGEPFHTGEANPHLVEGCGRHWLLSC